MSSWHQYNLNAGCFTGVENIWGVYKLFPQISKIQKAGGLKRKEDQIPL